MRRLKNRHFTLRRACTHLDHLAAHIHGDIGMLKPVCAYNKESVVFFAPSLLNIKSLYPISWLSQKSKTNKNIPASDPSSSSQRRKRWEEMRQGEEWREETREADIWIQASTRLSKKGDTEERRWMKEEWISQGDFSWGLNEVYVFTQPANNSVQGAWPHSIHHTHHQVEKDETPVPTASHSEYLNESHSQ